ncbi:MAG: hypothetical protein Q4G69_03760 [Planctomycetia bacterium]|nr:hypothetical protein [Planctomycetia bacterium]
MKKKKISNPFSLFAFQDIITSVSGIFIFLTLLLALDLVSRVLNASMDTPAPRENFEKMKEAVKTFSDEIKKGNELIAKKIADQAVFLNLSEEQLAEINRDLEKQIKETRQEMERLKKNYTALEKEEKNIPLYENDLKRLQKKLSDLQKQNIELDKQIEIVQNNKMNFFSRESGHKETPWVVDLCGTKTTVLSLSQKIRKDFPDHKAFLRWIRGCNRQTEYFILVVRPSACEFCGEVQDDITKAGFKIGVEIIGENEEIIVQDKKRTNP